MSKYRVVIDADDTQYEAEVEFSVSHGCKETRLSPAEPATLDIDFAPIEEALGREPNEQEIEEQVWDHLSALLEWSD